MQKPYLLVTLLLLVLFSCKKNDNQNSVNTSHNSNLTFPTDVPGDTITVNNFPLQIGNSWTYTVKTDSASSYDFTVSVVSDSIINGFHVYKIAGINSSNELFLSENLTESFPSYYVQTNNGLYYLKTLDNIDSANIANAYVILKYQPAPWYYQESDGFNAHKSFSGYAKVSTPIQTFNCIKISTSSHLSSWSNNTEQYFSDKGLIMQTQVYDYATHDGTFINKKIMILKSVNF